MTYFPLHDESSNFYADAEDMNDCTVAKLDGSEDFPSPTEFLFIIPKKGGFHNRLFPVGNPIPPI